MLWTLNVKGSSWQYKSYNGVKDVEIVGESYDSQGFWKRDNTVLFCK